VGAPPQISSHSSKKLFKFGSSSRHRQTSSVQLVYSYLAGVPAREA
jgi:hypothetical protein